MVKREGEKKYSYAAERKLRVEKAGKVEKKPTKKIQKNKAKTLSKFQKIEHLRKKKAPKKSTFELTFNVRKSLRGVGLRKRAPRAIREIKRYVRQHYGTSLVKIHPDLNTYIGSQGIRNPPKKVRLVLERKPCEEEERKGKYYTFVHHKIVGDFSNLFSKRIVEEASEKKN
jgi:large subunit ribosomal protein L31e